MHVATEPPVAPPPVIEFRAGPTSERLVGSAAEVGRLLIKAGRYERDPSASQFRTDKFYPVVSPSIGTALGRCAPPQSRRSDSFRLFFVFKAGLFDRVVISPTGQYGGCVGALLARVIIAAAPLDDFVEMVEFKLDPAPQGATH